MRQAGGGKGGQAHLFEVVLAAPAPRTGGGDKPPLWVQRTAWLPSGPDMQAGEMVGAYCAQGSIALRSLLPPNPSAHLNIPERA